MKRIILNQQRYRRNFNIGADVITPTAPSSLTASNISANSVDLNWVASTDNVGVVNYGIYDNGTFVIATNSNANSYSLSGLFTSTFYNLTVRALDAAGNESGDSNIEVFQTTINPDVTPPTAPTNLTASNITDTTVDIAWTESTDLVGVVSYNVYNSGVLLATFAADVTSRTVTGLTPDTAYSLTVRGVDLALNESSDSNIEGFTTAVASPSVGVVTGDLERYNKTTITFPALSLSEAPATYLDYRMNVTITAPSSASYVVPAYFAADGDAAETSATSGNKWRCHFNPKETGVHTYTVSFRTGTNIAADLSPTAGTPTSIDGDNGSFTIGANTVTGNDFRAKGKLQYVGEKAARFDNGTYYLEVGADSPETFLEYGDFDATTPRHDYAEVAGNYEVGDPTWQGGKGTEIIGAVNYLANQGMNIQYLLTMNITGDGQRAYPFPTNTDYTTYDCSKLDQWQIVFDHMYNKGIALEMVFTEQENLNWFEMMEGSSTSGFGIARKLYYREMIARFGYLNVIYSIGEEANEPAAGDVYTAQQIEDAAEFVQDLSPYNDLVTVHNGPSAATSIFNEITALSGTNHLTSISRQADWQRENQTHGDWVGLNNLAVNDGTKWVLRLTEPYASSLPDVEGWTNTTVWGSITGGAVGVHYYSFNGDVGTDDYTTYSVYYQRMKHMKDFFEDNNIPFWSMDNDDANISTGYLLSDDTSNFVGYFANGGSNTITIAGSDNYTVKWYDPRNGGTLQDGSVTSITGGTNVSLGTPPNNTTSSWVVYVFTPLAAAITNNLADEEAYFAAHLVTVAQGATLQTAIDTYGDTVGVRLEQGNYCQTGAGFSCNDAPIIMTSNQKLYGHPSAHIPSTVPKLIIASGSTGVEIRKLLTTSIEFEAGAPITNCTLTSIQGNIFTINGQLENNWFIDVRSRLSLDCSVSGYLRNNTVLRHQVSAGTGQWDMHGNATTPSYGCMHMAVNILNPWDNGVNISGIEDITIIGLDAEAWNWQSLSPNAMLYMRNMGSVKITDLGGSIAGYLPASSWTPAWDIEANKLNIFNSGIYNIVANPSIVTGDGDVFMTRQTHNGYTTNAGYDAKVFFNAQNGIQTDAHQVTYNGSEIITPISSGAAYDNLKDGMLLPQKIPYDRVTHETLPNPTGGNWATDRIGQADSHDFIQNLIDTNGIAELAEGIFYIASPLTLTNDQGIIGQGTGKTAIVGLTDDFPLIESYNLGSVTGIYKITVSNMTLQGGESGLKLIDNGIVENVNDTMSVFSTFDFLIFRNQQSGFHLFQIFGMDNHIMNQVSYVDCGIGFHQDPKRPWEQEFKTMTYVDKVLFYKNQYINCGKGVEMNATRANNLDTFYGCNFDGNGEGIEISATNYGQIINSDFTNHNGAYVVGGGAHLYNCDFTGNTTTNTLNGNALYMEGCNLNDNIPLMARDPHAIKSFYIKNSTVAGTLGVQNRINRAIFMNSSFPNEPSINKLLVTRKPNDPNWDSPFEYVIIDEAPNPYPMFLVKYN